MDVEAFTDVAGAASMCPPLLSMHLSSHCFCKELEVVNKVNPGCKAVHRSCTIPGSDCIFCNAASEMYC